MNPEQTKLDLDDFVIGNSISEQIEFSVFNFFEINVYGKKFLDQIRMDLFDSSSYDVELARTNPDAAIQQMIYLEGQRANYYHIMNIINQVKARMRNGNRISGTDLGDNPASIDSD